MSVLLAFGATVGVIMVVVGLVVPQTTPNPVQMRLSRFVERPRSLEEIELEQPFTERVIRPIITKSSQLMQKFLPKRNRGKNEEPALGGLQKRLLLAGSPNGLSANEFLGIIGICMFVMAGTAFLLVGLAGGDALTAGLVSLVGLLIGYFVPTFWLSTKISSRQREIQRAMPDALDILVISVEAGLGFDAALQRLTEKANNALSREFHRVISEVRLGRPRREALREMVHRTEVPDLNTFVSAIIQADQLGVSVSRVLTVQAEQMRMLRRQRAEELAAKAPLKMLFPMVFLIFPAMFIVILGPAMVTMFGSGGF